MLTARYASFKCECGRTNAAIGPRLSAFGQRLFPVSRPPSPDMDRFTVKPAKRPQL
jgi:hypothetical protein